MDEKVHDQNSQLSCKNFDDDDQDESDHEIDDLPTNQRKQTSKGKTPENIKSGLPTPSKKVDIFKSTSLAYDAGKTMGAQSEGNNNYNQIMLNTANTAASSGISGVSGESNILGGSFHVGNLG